MPDALDHMLALTAVDGQQTPEPVSADRRDNPCARRPTTGATPVPTGRSTPSRSRAAGPSRRSHAGQAPGVAGSATAPEAARRAPRTNKQVSVASLHGDPAGGRG